MLDKQRVRILVQKLGESAVEPREATSIMVELLQMYLAAEDGERRESMILCLCVCVC
jgi:hypothetical protein